MDPKITPQPEKILSPLAKLLAPLTKLSTPITKLLAPLEKLPIPKKLVIPALAGAVLLITGGAAFGLFHAKAKHAVAPLAAASAAATAAPAKVVAAKAVAAEGTPVKAGPAPIVAADAAPSKEAPSAAVASKAVSAACGGVVRDIYRQTVSEDPSVTLAEVRAEVLSSGVSCTPVPEISAELKALSPACRAMVQYTYLGVHHDGNADITVNDIREKVVEKSVACEHDRGSTPASAAGHNAH